MFCRQRKHTVRVILCCFVFHALHEFSGRFSHVAQVQTYKRNTLPTPASRIQTKIQLDSLRNSDEIVLSNASGSDVEFKFLSRKHFANISEDSASTFEVEERTRAACNMRDYRLDLLPAASVIICFCRHEKFVDIVHSVHSIVANTPRNLLQEVLLVADGPVLALHVRLLREYLTRTFGDVVRLLHSPVQLGIPQCRLQGARAAMGHVLISLDAHVEVQPGWLPPLLLEIHRDPRTLASPMLDWMTRLAPGLWKYEKGSSRYIAIFDWSLSFLISDLPDPSEETNEALTTALTSPTSVGTWAVHRNFFAEIGELDVGMQLWGGENIDLALRAFLFGGRHVTVPCSHVAHLETKLMRKYRRNFDPSTNYMRIVETWFDEYKDFFYLYRPELKGRQFGDISHRLDLKKRAKYNFRYYLNRFYPDLAVPGEGSLAWGCLMNAGASQLHHVELCLTSGNYRGTVGLEECGTVLDRNKIIIMWSMQGALRTATMIHDVQDGQHLSTLAATAYRGTPHPPAWVHWRGGPLVRYQQPLDSPKLRCLEALHDRGNIIVLNPCNITNNFQLWTFQHYSKTYEDHMSGSINYRLDNPGSYSQERKFLNDNIRMMQEIQYRK